MSNRYGTSSSVSQFLNDLEYSISSAKYTSASAIASLAVTLGCCVLLFLAFLILRVRIKTLYASKSSIGSQTFEYPGSGVLDWVKPVYKTEIEEELLPKVGLDAVTFLKVVRMCRNIFVPIGILGCAVCIPLSVIFNRKSTYADNLGTDSDPFIVMTPTLLSGNQMLGHVILGWVIDIIIIINLALTFKDILRYRKLEFEDSNHRANVINRTVMAYDIPNRLRSDKGLKTVAHECDCMERPYSVSMGTSVKRLEELMSEHKRCIVKLEKCICTHERHCAKNTVRASDLSKIRVLEGERSKLEEQIMHERHSCRMKQSPLSYGFISYRTQNAAHSVAQQVRGRKVEGTSVRLAPAPGDIIWLNLAKSKTYRVNRRFWINVLYTILLVLWVIPAAILGCFFTNLKQVSVIWHGFSVISERSKVGFAILQGVVAPAITALIFALLPPLLRKMCKWEGNITRTDREKEVIRKLFVLFFLVNFLVFTCMGVIWDIVVQVVDITKDNKALTFSEVWDRLKVSERFTSAVIKVSSFWVMYLIHGCTGLFVELAQLLSLIIRTYQRLFTAYTPRMRAQWYEPQPYYYANTYIWMVFYTSIALGLTVVQPLVLIVMAAYFVLAYPLKKYELMYVCYTKNESSGLFWPVIHNIMVFSTAFGNLVLLCVVWVQSDYKVAIPLVPLPIIMLIYKIVSYYQYERHYWFFTHACDDEQKCTLGDPEIVDIYENPALRAKIEEPILQVDREISPRSHLDEKEFIDEPEPLRPDSLDEPLPVSHKNSRKISHNLVYSPIASADPQTQFYNHPNPTAGSQTSLIQRFDSRNYYEIYDNYTDNHALISKESQQEYHFPPAENDVHVSSPYTPDIAQAPSQFPQLDDHHSHGTYHQYHQH